MTKYNLGDQQQAYREIDKIKDIVREQHVLTLRKEQLYASKGTTEEEYNEALVESFRTSKSGDLSIEDITLALTELNIVPNADIAQTLNYVSNYVDGVESMQGVDAAKQVQPVIDYINETKGTNITSSNIFELGKGYNTAISKSDAELAKDLDVEVKTDALIIPSFADPLGGTAKTFKTLFEGASKGGGFMDSFVFKTKTGETITWAQLKDSDKGIFEDYKKLRQTGKAPTIDYGNTGLVAIPTPEGDAVLAITFEGKDGTQERYYANTNQFTTPDGSVLNKYINGTEFKVQKIYRQGEHAKLVGKYEPIDFIDNDEYLKDNKTPNPFHKAPTVIFDYSGEHKVHILETNPKHPKYGEYHKYDADLGLKEIAGYFDRFNIKL